MRYISLSYLSRLMLILFKTISFGLTAQIQDIEEKFSLFYTVDELNEKEIKAKKDVTPQHLHKIHLKALFYTDAHTWTLWINDVKLSSSETHSLYKILQVTAEYVVLDWWYQGKFNHIQLRPNQSYDAKREQIVEGLI